MIISNKIN